MDTHDPNDRSGAAKPDASDVGHEAATPAQRADHDEPTAPRRRVAKREPPPAPAAVEIAPPETGPLLVQATAAATYVAPQEISLPEAPSLPAGPVRIHEDVDPRRKPTVRVARKGLSAAAIAAGVGSDLGGRGEQDAAGEPSDDGGAAARVARARRAARSPGRAPKVPKVQSRPIAAADLPKLRSDAGGARAWRRWLTVGAAILLVAGPIILWVVLRR
jgi:hypothetical protein